jgi:cytochrome c biogenesis protein CcmG, thiol:disulfide interchange protein DsbE
MSRPRAQIRMLQIPLRPGRPAFSKRTRRLFAIVLVVLVAAILAGGALLLHSSPKARVVTIPAADRNASPKLIRAAEEVEFRPPHLGGTGKVEGGAVGSAPQLTAGLLPVGARAPDFTLRTPAGTRVSLRTLRGRAVLLEFFATWCPHCNAEAPHLHDLYARLPHTKVAFVSIDGNSDDAPSVFAYHVWYGLQFPAVLDQGDHTVTFPEHGPLGPVSRSYGVSGWPTFYVLDPRGRVRWRSAGEQPDAQLARELERAILAG